MARSILPTLSLLLGVALAAPAQDPPGPPARRGASAEAILGMRARLQLTDAQIARLTALRRDALQRRTEAVTERLALQSELRAGELTRDALAARLATRREALRAGRTAEADAVRDLLTESQRDRLGEIRRQALRQRGAARGGRWGGRGAWRAPRMGPGRGEGWAGPRARAGWPRSGRRPLPPASG